MGFQPIFKEVLLKHIFLQPHCHFGAILYEKLQHKPLFLQPMKFFAFIIGFFLLYLSCQPCGDSRECNKKTEGMISATDNHQQSNHNAENCTPFCTCSCCATSVFFSSYFKTPESKAITQAEKFPLYDITFNSEVFSSIWQPPQLS